MKFDRVKGDIGMSTTSQIGTPIGNAGSKLMPIIIAAEDIKLLMSMAKCVRSLIRPIRTVLELQSAQMNQELSPEK